MSDLVAFINDRLDEDQGGFEIAIELHPPSGSASALNNHEWCRRMLRGVEAKRQILELHRQVGRIRDPRRDKITFDHKIDICEVCGPFEWPHGEFGYLDVWHDDEGYPTLYPCRTVRLMGTEWSAHEVYLANREKWTP